MPSFLAPLFLVGAAAAVIPIVLHLLKREPEPRVKFTAVRLLRNAPVEHSARHRLRELLLLGLRIAALVLLALAFARPFFPSSHAMASTGVTIVAIDTSFSMGAPGQFERARQLAREEVARAGAGQLVGLVTFADRVEQTVAPTTDRALVQSAIEAARPSFGATRYRAGVGAAATALAGRTGTISVITDLQESGWDAGDRAAVPESARLEVRDVGAPPPNLAVTATKAVGDRILATVRNTSPSIRHARLRLTVDGRETDASPLTIGPNQTVETSFGPLAGGTEASIAVEDGQGAPADNIHYLVLEHSQHAPVIVLTTNGVPRDALFVHHALSNGRFDASPVQLTGLSASQLSKGDAAVLGPASAVLVLSTRGLEPRGRELIGNYVRSGGGVLIAVGPDVDGEVIGDVFGHGFTLAITMPADTERTQTIRAMIPADLRHPIFESFGAQIATLGVVRFRQAARVNGSSCQTLARFSTGDPAMLDCEVGEGRGLVLASDLDRRWNDFPLHGTFVPFLNESVRYLASSRHRSVNEYLVGDVPPGVPPTPGFASLPEATTGGRPRRVAINVDPRESEPGRLSEAEFQSAVARSKDVAQSALSVESREQEDRQHVWQYALAMMLMVLALEGWVASRTA